MKSITEEVEIPLEQLQPWYNYHVDDFANLVEQDDGSFLVVSNEDESSRFFKQIENPVGKLYFHQDEGAEVLFVAHLDTVVEFTRESEFTLEEVASSNADKTPLHKL